MNRKKILVVDDDDVLLKAMSMKLVANGYDVVTAQDGAAAVAKARQEKPDLILLDLVFPPDVAHGGGVPWDGFLIMNWLRRIDEARNIPVIMISGREPVKHKQRALAAGALGFFHKPVDQDQLFSVITKALASEKAPVPASKPASKRILFVDDEGDWRLVAGTCLEDAGYEVLTAKDVAEALRRMEKVKLNAIILDVNLGGENGLLLMEFLKQSHPGVPILVYTGMQHDEAAIQAILKDGAYRYLRKGTMGELCDAIKSIVE